MVSVSYFVYNVKNKYTCLNDKRAFFFGSANVFGSVLDFFCGGSALDGTALDDHADSGRPLAGGIPPGIPTPWKNAAAGATITPVLVSTVAELEIMLYTPIVRYFNVYLDGYCNKTLCVCMFVCVCVRGCAYRARKT